MKDGQVDIRSSLAAGGTCLLPITPMVKGMGSKLATTLYDAGLVDKAGKNTISKLSSQSSFLFEAGTSTFLAEISSSANSHQEIMCVAPSKRTSELNFKREESYACWVPVVSNKTSNESPSDGAYGGASGGPSGGSGGGGYYFNEELGRPMPNPPPP
jgi:hypothetical protein